MTMTTFQFLIYVNIALYASWEDFLKFAIYMNISDQEIILIWKNYRRNKIEEYKINIVICQTLLNPLLYNRWRKFKQFISEFEPYYRMEFHNTSNIKQACSIRSKEGYGITWHTSTDKYGWEVWKPNESENDNLLTKEQAVSKIMRLLYEAYTNGYRFVMTPYWVSTLDDIKFK